MTSPLLPVGIAALGTLAVQTMRHLNPGDFLRELRGSDKPTDSELNAITPPPSLDLSHAIPAFADKLRQRLLAAGVELEHPLVLKDDGWGNVVVDGDHPDRILVEDLLASDAELVGEFQEVAQAASVQRQQDKALFGLGSSLGEFRLQMGSGNATIRFE